MNDADWKMPKKPRAQRRTEAEALRKVWRLRWLNLAQTKNQSGVSVRECIIAVASDADALIRSSPHLKSEITLALDEFSNAVALAVVQFRDGSNANATTDVIY